MLDKYQGCLVGAVLGSALGMSSDQMPVRPRTALSFGRAYPSHPNHNLLPGQYSGDGVIILIASRNLSEGRFDAEAYARELHRAYRLNKLRSPDGAVFSVCRKIDSSKNYLGSAVYSETAGCLALSIPFALRYTNRKAMATELVSAVSVTHTHPASLAASIGFSLLLNTLVQTGEVDEAFAALDSAAQNMDTSLLCRLLDAYRFAQSRMSVVEAANIIGTTSLVYHTLPMAMFLCRRFTTPEETLEAAVSIGGNAGTISMLCGAFVGAKYGLSNLPSGLLTKLERAGIFAELATTFYTMEHSPKNEEPKEKSSNEYE